MKIPWQCPSCGRQDVQKDSCLVCQKWNSVPDFTGSLSKQSQDQATLHDTKGQKINSWPRYPLTVLQAQRGRWFQRLQQLPKGRVLEVGCHRSGVLDIFAQTGWQICGVDVSRQSIEDQSLRHPGSFAVASAQTIPLPEQSIDLVLAIHVLEHVDDLNQALKEINRVLSPQGHVFIEIPVKDFGLSWERFRFRLNPSKWILGAAAAGHQWDKIPIAREFESRLKNMGFEIHTFERGWVWLTPLWEHFLQWVASLRKKKSQTSAGAVSKENKTQAQKPPDKSSFLKKIASGFVRGLDCLENRIFPNRRHGASMIYLVSKSKSEGMANKL